MAMVVSSIEDYAELLQQDPVAAEMAASQTLDLMRMTGRPLGAYGCGIAQDRACVAFPTASAAIQFCLTVSQRLGVLGLLRCGAVKQKAAKQACGSAGSTTLCPVQLGVLGHVAMPVNLLHGQQWQADLYGGAASIEGLRSTSQCPAI